MTLKHIDPTMVVQHMTGPVDTPMDATVEYSEWQENDYDCFLTPEESGPEMQAMFAENKAQLDDALTRLPAEQRRILQLYYENGLSISQVGHTLGLTEDQAKYRHERALVRMRKEIRYDEIALL